MPEVIAVVAEDIGEVAGAVSWSPLVGAVIALCVTPALAVLAFSEEGA